MYIWHLTSCIYASQGGSCCVKHIAILQLTVRVCRLEMSLYREIPWVSRVPWESHENRIHYTLISRKWDWEGMITRICRELWGLLQMTTQTISLWLFMSVRHCLLWHWMCILCSLVVNRRSRSFHVIDFCYYRKSTWLPGDQSSPKLYLAPFPRYSIAQLKTTPP